LTQALRRSGHRPPCAAGVVFGDWNRSRQRVDGVLRSVENVASGDASSRTLRNFDVAMQETVAVGTFSLRRVRRSDRTVSNHPRAGAAAAPRASSRAWKSRASFATKIEIKRAMRAFQKILRSADVVSEPAACVRRSTPARDLKRATRGVQRVVRVNLGKIFCVDVLTVRKLVFSFRPTARLSEKRK
jgi:hypothetical protein